MAEHKSKGIPLGERWDTQEAMLLHGALPKAIRPNKSLNPKNAQAAQTIKSALSDKTYEMLRKLKGKR